MCEESHTAEDLKKTEEDEDSETWSNSFPSYSRFTFTGKTKSRLGRNYNRTTRPTFNVEDLKAKEDNIHSNDNNTAGPNVQAPKTPGWLQGGTRSVSNNLFTPNAMLKHSQKTPHDGQTVVNDSGIDVSLQSNFVFNLKNDSAQSSCCRRTLPFDNTPFKSERGHESSNKEHNVLFPKSLAKLDFSCGTKGKNKENVAKETMIENVKNKDSISFDPTWNQLKKICDSAISQPPVTKNVSVPSGSEYVGLRNCFSNNPLFPARTPNKPVAPSIFAPYNTSDRGIEQKIGDDGFSDTPVDLSSSGENFTSKTVFSRVVTSGNHQGTAETPATGTTDLPRVPEQATDARKCIEQKNSSDSISSILPKFLIPTNKTKSREPCTEGDGASEMFLTLMTAPMNPLPDFNNHISLVQSPPNNPFTVLPNKNVVSSQLSSIIQEGGLLTSDVSEKNSQNLKIDNEEKIHSVVSDNAMKPLSNLQKRLSGQDRLLNVSEPAQKTSAPSSEGVTSKFGSNIDPFVNPIPNGKEQDNESRVASHPFIGSINDKCVSNQHRPETNPENRLIVASHHRPELSSNNRFQKRDGPMKVIPHSQIYQGTHIPVLSDKKIESFNSGFEQMSAQHLPASTQKQIASDNPGVVSSKQQVQNIQRFPQFGHQKTYLAPQHPPDHRIASNKASDFPHAKPEIPLPINSRPISTLKMPQDHFKTSAPRGLLSRANTELHVNKKAYTILSMLGRGGSSEVYQVLDHQSSKLLAVKCVDLSMVDRTVGEGYLNEIDLLSRLQGCPSVIRMFDYEYIQEQKMLYVVMEKGDTDLSHLIKDISKTKKISMPLIIYYWTEMLTAVQDIHEHGIIHSDLKPANFLLVSGRLKLIDFGIASSQGDMTSVVKEVATGTWNYMSPEAIQNTSSSGKGYKITYKSDVWSLGCILYNLVYGKTPFSHITNMWAKIQAIADCDHRIQFPDVGAPMVLAQALRSCLHRDPKQRPTVAKLLSLHDYTACDTNHIGRQLVAVLPHEYWLKVSHLFPDVKPEEECADDKRS